MDTVAHPTASPVEEFVREMCTVPPLWAKAREKSRHNAGDKSDEFL